MVMSSLTLVGYSLALVVIIAGVTEIIGADDIASHTTLCLYIRSNQHCSKITVGNSSSLSAFNVNKHTKIIIPGWLDPAYNFKNDLKQGYLAAKDVNLITFDWTYYTLNQRAVVEPVGEYLAAFIDWLVSTTGVSVDAIHVVGFSLGGQLAGVVGEHVTVGKLGRITGLDPVAVTFNLSPEGRLDSSDAQFVDVIHTCGGLIGWYDPCGHVDFYPNGGTVGQLGCPLLDFGVCSHTRAFRLFIESITSEGFVSTACESWVRYKNNSCAGNIIITLGENVNQRARGKFYLKTASSPPYALR